MICPACGTAFEPNRARPSFDNARRIVFHGRKTAPMPGALWKAALLLVGRLGNPVSAEDLADAVYGDGAEVTSHIRAIVSQVRRHIRPLGLIVVNDRGRGYIAERGQ